MVLCIHFDCQGSFQIRGFKDDKREMGRKLGIAQEFMEYRRV
jgi:hypothetical protein